MTKLAGIFSNGMVLQRDTACAIWGKEESSGQVTVYVENKEYTSDVRDGSFLVELPAHEAATGITMVIEGSEKITLTDVCYGDVYLLTGQSNMELPVSRTRDVSGEEIDASDYPFIRQYRVTPQYRLAEDKMADLPELPWTKATPDQIGEMSATGFYAARRIYDVKKVPIGLVLGAQGGSTVESWMPSELLKEFGDYEKIFQPFTEDGALQEYLNNRNTYIEQARKALESDEDAVLCKEIPADAVDFSVPGMILPEKTYEMRKAALASDLAKSFAGKDEQGRTIKELLGGEVILPQGFCGVVWFYKEFELAEEPEGSAFAYVGNLIDADQTFVNGVLIGRTEYRYPPRKYTFDSKILKKGKNLICVRLLIENRYGGFVGAHPYYLTCGKEKIDLSGTWKMKKGVVWEDAMKDDFSMPYSMLGQEVPTGLFKATIRPLKNYRFCGIWWYQGEANSADPKRYNEKFSSMIRYWRSYFGSDLPVIAVEMADYSDPALGALPEGWREIQAQQCMAEKEISGCRVVSAKDLTTPLDLHPQRKSELGARIAEVILKG